MIKYENIEFLYLLFGTPIIIAAILMYKKWQKKSIEKFGDPLLVQKLIPSRSKNKIYVKNILTVVIFILFSIGLSNPQVGVKMEEVKRKGVDLIIAIDLSKSMMVEDIKPNRLEAAKHAISKLIDRLEGDRVGLIVFAEEAYVQLPITTDYSAAKLFLSTINTEIVATQGTNIGNAIDLSVKSFDLENRQEKAIIIITDGETHDEKAITAAENASESGIFIHTLGMGLNKGGLIPKYNDNGIKIKGEFKKDRQGNVITSKLNEDILKKIAISGKGSYIRANNSQIGLSKLFAKINEMEKREIGTMVFTEHKDRFQYFLFLCFILIVIFLIIVENKIKKIKF